MNIYKNKFMSRFGLMHMIATNICNWLKVLILETSHEIKHMDHGANHTFISIRNNHHQNHDIVSANSSNDHNVDHGNYYRFIYFILFCSEKIFIEKNKTQINNNRYFYRFTQQHIIGLSRTYFTSSTFAGSS